MAAITGCPEGRGGVRTSIDSVPPQIKVSDLSARISIKATIAYATKGKQRKHVKIV